MPFDFLGFQEKEFLILGVGGGGVVSVQLEIYILLLS